VRRFFDPSAPVLTPADVVRAFTHRQLEELSLPERAVIVFSSPDLKLLVKESGAVLIPAWSPFKALYLPGGKKTILTRSHFGGPSIAALVEELAAFGVAELCLWGYCGAISRKVAVGDILLATGALREDGISHHYLDAQDEFVKSEWAAEWEESALRAGFLPGTIWTIDAIYRETRDKVEDNARKGIIGVEMEAASFYAVCNHKGLRSVAFLVVSDLLSPDGWSGGFGSPALKRGARTMADFVEQSLII
jgi:nucleoside phosphorylase